MLRRNVHRLEKGLVMTPRQPVFAEDYIGETVAEFGRCLELGGLDPAEEKWARDVLTGYFAAISDTPSIQDARARFHAHAAETLRSIGVVEAGAASAPRPRNAGVSSGIDYDAFLALCRQRRSVRWFLPQVVPESLVERAVAAAAQAPSACNRQPFLYRYFGQSTDAARIASIALGTAGYAQNIPALVVVLGDLAAYPYERDRHLVYIDAALATMQFMLALETQGLASCPINWPDIESCERKMTEALALPAHIRPILLVALGYPDPVGGVPFSAKKPVDMLLRRDNTYDS
jgi:nitroreductase